jgi:hypothetical protein
VFLFVLLEMVTFNNNVLKPSMQFFNAGSEIFDCNEHNFFFSFGQRPDSGKKSWIIHKILKKGVWPKANNFLAKAKELDQGFGG